MFARVVDWCWRQLAAHWTTLLAVIGIGGMLAAELYRPIREQQSVYFFICLNAIVWTLIRVKVQLDRLAEKDQLTNAATVFPTMRKAEGTVVKLLIKEVGKRETGRAIVMGGRIRSIIDLIHEFEDELGRMGMRSKTGCDIQIFMMSPDFVSSLILPGKVSAEQQRAKNETVSGIMRGNMQELRDMCEREPFRSNNVRISTHYYRETPFGYYYVIGDEDIVFGGYIWSEENSDLIGPSSPCWHITARSPEFDATSKWLRNRTALYIAQESASQIRENASDTAATSQVTNISGRLAPSV